MEKLASLTATVTVVNNIKGDGTVQVLKELGDRLMNRGSLARLIRFKTVDLYSVDSLTRKIRTQDGLKIEELYLKEMGDPTPSEDRYGNIPCIVMQSTGFSERSALIYLQEEGTAALEKSSWLQEVARGGVIVLGMNISKEGSLGRTVARVLKGVSYLNLRRDLVDPGQIFLWGTGAPGVWGLLSAILDERASGVVLEEAPREVVLGTGEVLRTAEVCDLLPPRRLAVIGLPDVDTAFERTRRVYDRMGNAEALRFEKDRRDSVKDEVLRWILQGGSE